MDKIDEPIFKNDLSTEDQKARDVIEDKKIVDKKNLEKKLDIIESIATIIGIITDSN